MERLKKALDRFFIDGLSAMAHGLFRDSDHRHDHSADRDADRRTGGEI